MLITGPRRKAPSADAMKSRAAANRVIKIPWRRVGSRAAAERARARRSLVSLAVFLLSPMLFPMHAALARAPLRATSRSVTPSCSFFDSDDRVDRLVLYGDGGVLLGYGSLQGFADALGAPFADSSFQPVASAGLQGIAFAVFWVGITLALKGYRPAATRTLPSQESLMPLVTAWIGSSAVLLIACALAGQSIQTEAEFVVGGGVVVGGWRGLYSQGLPLP